MWHTIGQMLGVQKDGDHTLLEKARGQGIFHKLKQLIVNTSHFGICGKAHKEKGIIAIWNNLMQK